MKTIYKYPIDPRSEYLNLPAFAEILTIQVQHGVPTIWALVDPDSGQTQRKIYIIGTGHKIETELGKYIGTFQLDGGFLVFHAFEAP